MLDFFKVNDTNIETLGRIHSTAWQASHKGIASDAYLNTITPENQTNYFKEKMQDTANHYFLIYLRNEPIGMISFNYSPNSSVGELVQLYFLPEYCGKGYGKIAIDFGLNFLKSTNVTQIKLWVMNCNKNAQKLYKKCGFTYTGNENVLDVERDITEQCLTFTL